MRRERSDQSDPERSGGQARTASAVNPSFSAINEKSSPSAGFFY